MTHDCTQQPSSQQVLFQSDVASLSSCDLTNFPERSEGLRPAPCALRPAPCALRQRARALSHTGPSVSVKGKCPISLGRGVRYPMTGAPYSSIHAGSASISAPLRVTSLAYVSPISYDPSGIWGDVAATNHRA